jgi:hypothetical protein
LSKLTQAQKEQLKICIINANVKRLSTVETQQYIKEKIGVDIGVDYIWHLRGDIKRDVKKTFEELRKDRNLYLNSIFFDRVDELRYMQKVLHEVIVTNTDDGDIQIKAVNQLQSITNQPESYYMALPKIAQVENADVNTLFPLNPNNNNNSSSSSSSSSNTSSSSSTAGVVVNNPTRWCDRCNCNHPLDKEGFKKCPEFKVGMPYEDEAGYYEREDYDLERKF